MRHSIRTRITFIFIGLTVLILLAVWAANTWLLEDYYVQDKIKILEEGYTSIDTILQKYPLSELEPYSEGSNADELSEVLKDLGDRYNTTIVLVDNVTGNAVVSSARDKNFLVRRLLGYALDQSEEPVEVIRKYDNYVIQRSYNPLDRSADLEAWGFFSDNTTLFIMSIPLSSVWESVDLSNRFLLIVGSIVMVLGSLIIYLVIRKITLPDP